MISELFAMGTVRFVTKFKETFSQNFEMHLYSNIVHLTHCNRPDATFIAPQP